jgi:hypothetical protein
LAGPPGGLTPHVPRVAPFATEQVPVQQSAPEAHASPPCPQNDDAWQVPPAQSDEQHSPPAAHLLPSVLQVVLSAPQTPLAQRWLQQSPSVVHAPSSEVHDG